MRPTLPTIPEEIQNEVISPREVETTAVFENDVFETMIDLFKTLMFEAISSILP